MITLINIKHSYFNCSILAVLTLILNACANPQRTSEKFRVRAIDQKNCPMCDLRYENLSQSDLSKGKFSGAYLFGANLSWSILNEINLDSAFSGLNIKMLGYSLILLSMNTNHRHNIQTLFYRNLKLKVIFYAL